MAQNGVSKTDPFGPGLSNYGSLKDFGVDDKYLKLAQAIAGKPREVDPAMAAFLYFSKMGELASQPGATLFGSAAGAASAPAQYLIDTETQNRKAEAAVPTTAINLMKALKPTASELQLSPLAKAKRDFQAGRITKEEYDALFAKLTNIPGDSSGASSPLGKLSEDFKKGLITKAEYDAGVAKATKAGGTSQKERYVAFINEIGPKIKAGDASPDEIATYGIYYQDLTQGFETTKEIDGVVQTVRVGGIDLTGYDNLPVPDGFDAEKVLSEKSKEWKSLGTNANFAQRMLFNEGIVRNVQAKGYQISFRDLVADNYSSWFGSTMQSPEGQEFFSASRNFIAAVLRKESGAAISDGEYINGLKQYFPQIGDTRNVVLQKQALREEAINGMVAESGDAFKSIYPDAVEYLTVEDPNNPGQRLKILNAQPYANQKLSKVKLGQDIYFKSTIDALSVDELKSMLANPNAGQLYSAKQIDLIGKKIIEKQGGG